MSIFSIDEMRGRVERLQKELSSERIDAAVLHTADNSYYMSGLPLLSAWGRPAITAVAADGDATLVLAMIERENGERNSWIRNIQAYADEENVTRRAVSLIGGFLKAKGHGRGRIGMELDYLSRGLESLFRTVLPDTELVDISAAMARLRVVKSREEQDLLRLGGEVAKIGAKAFVDALGDGVTELEIASQAVLAMNRELARRYPQGGSSSYSYCHTGVHTLTPHLHPTGRQLKQGDLVGLNVFPVIWGYCMELERTFVYGEPTVTQRRALDAVNEAFDMAKAATRPGASFTDLDTMTRRYFTDRGYRDYIRHGTGHAHGIMIGAASREELGEIRNYNRGHLAPGMVNSIEPGLYLPDTGGFRHSDVVLVTERGADLLTEFPRDIAV
jgi:creatinase